MNEITIDAKNGKYPYYLIEDNFLNLLIKIEKKGYFPSSEKTTDICFEQLNQISENILRGMGNKNNNYIVGILGDFRINNFKLNGSFVGTKTLFWSTYAYLNFRFDPSEKGKKKLEELLSDHLDPNIIFDLLSPYRNHGL